MIVRHRKIYSDQLTVGGRGVMGGVTEFFSVYWLHISAASLATCLFGMLLLSWIVMRLPQDYFLLRERRLQAPLSVSRTVIMVIRNLLAVAVVVLGAAMLLLPGPGLLFVLLGLTLMDIPQKRAALIALLKQEPLQISLNRMREKFGKPPFLFPRECRVPSTRRDESERS